MGFDDADTPAPSTIFPDEFLERLPLDPVRSLSEICQQFELHMGSTLTMNAANPAAKYQMLLDAYALLQTIYEHDRELIPIDIDLPELTADHERDLETIVATFNRIGSQIKPLIKQKTLRQKFEKSRDRYATMIGFVFVYQFEEQELAHAKRMLRRIADAVTTSGILEPEHHLRTLRRLRQLDAALKPVMTNLDEVHGCLIDLGITLSRFGQASKRFADPVSDVSMTVTNAQRRAFGLPPVPAGRRFIRSDSHDTDP